MSEISLHSETFTEITSGYVESKKYLIPSLD